MKTNCIRFFAYFACIPLVLACTSTKPVATTPTPPEEDFALRGMFQLTRAEVAVLNQTVPKKGKKVVTLPSGKNALCALDACALRWSAKKIPLFAGDRKAATLAVEEGAAKFTRLEIAGLLRLMNLAKKAGPRAFRRANQGQVICYPDRCTVDLAPVFGVSGKEATTEVLQALIRGAASTNRKL